jgi:hypothetical protein
MFIFYEPKKIEYTEFVFNLLFSLYRSDGVHLYLAITVINFQFSSFVILSA